MANENFALDLDLFDVQKNAYIPEQEQQKKRKIDLTLLEPKRASRTDVEKETRESRKMAIRACAFALVAFLMIGSLIMCRVEYTQRQLELNKMQNSLSVAQSENVALQMQYNSMMSVDKIEEYAQEKLGMVKRENYQISYFDISDEGGAQLTQ